MDLHELINRISFIRTQANLSARKLSLLIGKTAGYIHHMEQSKRFAPTFETLSDILSVCNVSFEKFFYYDITQYDIDKKIINDLKNTPKEKKEIIQKIIELK